MESPVPPKPRIVALGGGASKVVDRLVREGAVDADFIALNADAQDLKRSLAPTKLLLGAETTRRLGAAGDEESRRQAGVESGWGLTAGEPAEALCRDTGATELNVPEPRPLVVYVDVDDTLIRSFGSKQIPITSAIDSVRALCSEPDVVAYCWSSGGADYARGVCERLGIAELFVAFLPKPNVMVDDQIPAEWRTAVVVHPNEMTGLDAAGARAKLGWR